MRRTRAGRSLRRSSGGSVSFPNASHEREGATPRLYLAAMLSTASLLFYPLLLERSYGGAAEGWVILIQAFLGLLALAVCLFVFANLNTRAEEAYGEGYQRFLKWVGIVIVLFVVVYALASIGSH
jgi:hypothetical protein